MTQTDAIKAADLINYQYSSVISDEIFKQLGIRTSFVAEVKLFHGNYYLDIQETTKNTREQLTATPLLRHMFSDAHLYLNCWYFNTETDHELTVKVEVKYEHPSGGSNGLSLFRFYIDLNTNTVNY